jgi:hypothetical protein
MLAEKVKLKGYQILQIPLFKEYTEVVDRLERGFSLHFHMQVCKDCSSVFSKIQDKPAVNYTIKKMVQLFEYSEKMHRRDIKAKGAKLVEKLQGRTSMYQVNELEMCKTIAHHSYNSRFA